MKKLLALFLFLGCYQFSIAQFSAGAGLSVITGNTSAFGLQGRVMYGVNEDFTLGVAYNYYLEKNNGSIIDVDLQYSLLNTDNGFTLNPLVGFRIYGKGEVDTDLLLGVFSVIPIGDYHFYVEPKFVISKNDAFVVSTGFIF